MHGKQRPFEPVLLGELRRRLGPLVTGLRLSMNQLLRHDHPRRFRELLLTMYQAPSDNHLGLLPLILQPPAAQRLDPEPTIRMLGGYLFGILMDHTLPLLSQRGDVEPLQQNMDFALARLLHQTFLI